MILKCPQCGYKDHESFFYHDEIHRTVICPRCSYEGRVIEFDSEMGADAE